MIFCTSICSNYFDKAMVLAKSIKETHKDCKFIVCLVEDRIPSIVKECNYFDNVVLAKDLGIKNFNSHIFKHSIVEAATSVKGQLFRYLLDEYLDDNKFIYLDPDIKVYTYMEELDKLLDCNEIVLTPHIFEQETCMDHIVHNELNSLKYGIFNLGFLAIKRGKESNEFINWWNERLKMFCYNDIPNGIFTDQKWIDLSPCFFNVYILKHPGYNLAPWNYSTRKVTFENNEYLVNEKPLRFIHYSGLDSGANLLVTSKFIKNKNDIIYILLREYIGELEHISSFKFSDIKWSYDYFVSGEKICETSRRIYRQETVLSKIYVDPFEITNSVFTDLNEKISNEIWQKVISIEEYNIDKSLIEKMRFTLGYLSNKYSEKQIRYAIWGAGSSGMITRLIMKRIFPNFKLEKYIDTYKQGMCDKVEIISSEDIHKLNVDFIIISTSIGKEYAEKILCKHNYVYMENYFYGYGVR